MADPLGGMDEDAPPEPVIPLDPELEVRSWVLQLAATRPLLIFRTFASYSRNYGHRERVSWKQATPRFRY
jgi:hypothetical protein